MTRGILRRRPIQLLLLAALVFVIASAVPPAIINTMRPLKPGQSFTYATEPSETVSLVTSHAGDTIPEPNRDLPECTEPITLETPSRCLSAIIPSQQVTAVTTSETDEKDTVSVESVMQVWMMDTVMAEIRNTAIVDAHTVLPIPTPSAQMAVSVPDLSSGMATDPFVREGMHLFFPFPTQRVSYPWFDISLVDTVLLDYVGEEEVDGIDAYVFHYRLDGEALDRDSPNAISLDPEFDGPLDLLESSGFGALHYAVDRTLWVEPETGTILNQRELNHIYFANDDAESTARAFHGDPDYSVFFSDAPWDADTRAQQHTTASEQLSTMRWLQVFSVGLKSLSLILVLVAVALLIRERRKA
ncbi:MAG: porin PorA family protein [Corynebacterium sp.]|uniref:porin PorA family protein n=1 Tax=Corynebacterium sp. TaxID=1720 RepID=UPI0026E07937|nr:porin PorA family protein [Corynebacterium sp.]MDO5670896.1 porin PorA family protein [Corynebacterium sp.]